MISVVIPLYNKEKQIERTLRSLQTQTYSDFEVIIIDDGSTDNSVKEVEQFNDPRIRLIQQPNTGVSAARNRGIAEATGDFIALLDADDEWKPEYLGTQLSLTKKYPECNVFVCNYEIRDINGKVYPTIIRKLPFKTEDGVLSNYFEVASCSSPPICSISIMVKKGVIESAGGFPIGIRSGEDLLTWARLACNHSIVYYKIPLAIYNVSDGYDKKNLPPRRQDKGDPVGKELIELYHKYPKIQGMRKYISHWHKMRASVAIRYGDRIETIREVFISLKYNMLNIKVMPFIFLALLPKRIRHKIISMY